MKIGIPLLVIGVLMLLASIPYSIIMIAQGVFTLAAGDVVSGLKAWSPLIGVILGFILTTIGASRVFKN